MLINPVSLFFFLLHIGTYNSFSYVVNLKLFSEVNAHFLSAIYEDAFLSVAFILAYFKSLQESY